jgi:hypothetical protein
VFDGTNIVVLCISGFISTLLLFVGEADMWNHPTTKSMWITINLVAIVFVFIRNWTKTSFLCSIVETPLQFATAIVIVIALFIIATAICSSLDLSPKNCTTACKPCQAEVFKLKLQDYAAEKHQFFESD